jgi:hypothetical protein
MDLAFLRRAEQRFSSRIAVAPDPGVVSALLEVQRAASAAARAEAILEAPRVPDPIAEILLAGPGWQRAVAAQRGSFNPDLARVGDGN